MLQSNSIHGEIQHIYKAMYAVHAQLANTRPRQKPNDGRRCRQSTITAYRSYLSKMLSNRAITNCILTQH